MGVPGPATGVGGKGSGEPPMSLALFMGGDGSLAGVRVGETPAGVRVGETPAGVPEENTKELVSKMAARLYIAAVKHEHSISAQL